MKLSNIIIAIALCPFLMQGLCNKENIRQACTEPVTWSGNGKEGFYKSTAHDSHFRELFFAAANTPEDICTDVELRATFKITTVSADKIPNVNLIEGIIVWGDQENKIEIPFSVADHAYIATIEHIDLKPYFDEHPTADGSGSIGAEFKWYDLSVGSEATDLQYVKDKVAGMDVQVEYVKK